MHIRFLEFFFILLLFGFIFIFFTSQKTKAIFQEKNVDREKIEQFDVLPQESLQIVSNRALC